MFVRGSFSSEGCWSANPGGRQIGIGCGVRLANEWLPKEGGVVLQVSAPYHIRVLIPCYKESLEIVGKTIQAAYNAPLPATVMRTIYLCDDGRDPKKRKWCAFASPAPSPPFPAWVSHRCSPRSRFPPLLPPALVFSSSPASPWPLFPPLHHPLPFFCSVPRLPFSSAASSASVFFHCSPGFCFPPLLPRLPFSSTAPPASVFHRCFPCSRWPQSWF
jgi:hypothetical protein